MPHRAHNPRVPAVVVEQASQGELDSGDDHGKGRGGHRRLPLSPSWLPGRALFIELNIAIDLDNLTNWPDLTSCPALLLCIRRYGVDHVVYCPTGGRVSEQEDCSWSATATGHGQCQIEDALVPCRALPRYRAVQYSTQVRRQ